MKRVFLAGLLAVSALSASAHEWHHGGYHRERCWSCGVAPLAAGVIIGAELARPYPYIVNEPIYVQPQPVFVPQPTLPPPPYGYHYEQIFDSQINAQRIVLVPN